MTQTAELVTSDGADGDYDGSAVAIDGNTVAVAASQAAVNGTLFVGKAYIFLKPASGWSGKCYQAATLTASDGALYSYFGHSIAISGSTIVVGACEASIGGNKAQGAAYVFNQPASGWSGSLTQTAELTASDGRVNGLFGESVAISGNTFEVIGRSNVAGGWPAAYVFVQSNSTWTQTCELVASDATNDYLGFSMGMSGNTVVVGAPDATVGGNADQGAAFVFGPLALTPSTLPVGTENVLYSQTIAAQTIAAFGGTPPVNLTVSNVQGAIPGLTPGVDFPTSGTGTLVISGTPTATGTETFTVTATDSAGNTATANYSLTVQAIALSPATLPADTVSVPYSQAITALGGSNPGGATLSVSNIVGAVPGLNIPAAGTGSLAISGTPASSGTETFTVTATDSAGDTTSANYSITVNPAVALSPATLPADTVNVAYNQTITASGGTGTLALTVSNIAGAIPGLTVPASGTGSLVVSGTPTATGTETFTVTATDSLGAMTSTNYSITVNPAVTLSPTTLPTGTLNVAYNQTITAGGGTGAISLAVTNIAGKIKGLTVPSSGTGSLTISGTPTATGTETFTVTATDSVGGTATTNYSIKVTKTASSSVASAAEKVTVAQPTPTPGSGVPSVRSGVAILTARHQSVPRDASHRPGADGVRRLRIWPKTRP